MEALDISSFVNVNTTYEVRALFGIESGNVPSSQAYSILFCFTEFGFVYLPSTIAGAAYPSAKIGPGPSIGGHWWPLADRW